MIIMILVVVMLNSVLQGDKTDIGRKMIYC